MRMIFCLLIGCFIGWNTAQPEVAKNAQTWMSKQIFEIIKNGHLAAPS